MSAPACARCGNPATGYATINDDRYCHGDEPRPSCYEQAQRTARLLGAVRGHDLAIMSYTDWLDRKIAAGESAQARIKTIAADQRGRPRDRATRNTTRYGNVAQRLHDMRTAREVWREWTGGA